MNLGRELKGLGKNSLIYGVGGVLNRFIGFLLLPVFTSYLTPKEYGISAMLGWISFVVAPVFSLGFGAAMGICYFEGNNQDRKERTVWTSFALLVLSGSVLSAIAVFLPETISVFAFRTPQMHHLVTLGLLTAAISIISTPFPLFLQFEKRATLYVTMSAINTLVSIGFSIILVVVFRRGILGLVEAGLISTCISTCIFAIPALALIRFRLSRSVAREMLRHGAPLIPSFAFLFVMMHANKYILQWNSGLSVLGIYNIGFGFGTVMMIFVSAFTTAWYAYFMSFMDKPQETPELFKRILTIYLLGFGTLTLAFFAVAKPVVWIMTKPAFHEAYQVVGIIAAANALVGVFSIVVSTLYFTKEVRQVSIIQFATATICLLLSYPLIKYLGMMGTALDVLSGFLAMALGTYWWTRKYPRINVRCEWHRLVMFSLLGAVLSSGLLWPRQWGLPSEIVLTIIVLTCLPVLLMVSITESERTLVFKTVGAVFSRKLFGRA
jgi:O-antigen/teichoic acid export membrane protein